MSISDIKLRTAKPAEKHYKITDGGGLYLVVSPSGAKLWRLKYRVLGREKTLSLGHYPELSLKDARVKRDEAREQLAKQQDPGAEKKKAAVALAVHNGNTFKLVADEYLAKKAADGDAEATQIKAAWLLKQLEPSLGDRPISEIQAFEVLGALRKVERRGRLETAHRLRSFASRVFRYAIWTTRAQSDPAALLTGALRSPKTKHHAAIVEAEPLGDLLRAIEGFDGNAPLFAALRFQPHVFVRPGELRHATWSEFNLDEGFWRIPAGKMKMGVEHWVALSRQSVKILIDLREITGEHDYLFPSIRTWRRPMSENTFNVALRRLGFAADEMTGHGFRSTASTLLNESGLWQPDAIEVALAHRVEKGKVRGSYNRGRYWEERVRMAQWWSDYLDGLREGPRKPC